MPMNNKLMRPRATGFDPRSIAGLALWLDAGDASTVTLNGSNVSQWRDKSGSGLSPNATQSVAISQPAFTTSAINGRPAIDFATARSLTFASSTASFNYLHNATGGAVFVVIRPGASADPNAYGPFLDNTRDASANTGIGLVFDDRVSVSRNNAMIAVANRGVAGQQTAAVVANNFFATANAYCVLSVQCDCGNATAASRLRLWTNGVPSSATNAATNTAATGNASADLVIGNYGANTQAAISEMLFYQGVLTAGQRSAIERYLGKKYAITVA